MKLNYKSLAVIFSALAMVVCQPAAFDLNVDSWRTDASLFGGKAIVSTDGNTWGVVNAGQLRATFVGDIYNSYPQSWTTYCTDINVNLKSGVFEPLTWNEAELAEHYPVWTGSTALASSIYLTYRDDVASNSDAVGLQLAIWNALYNGSTWNEGVFQVKSASSGAFSYVDKIYGNLNELVAPELGSWWMPVSSDGSQRRNQGLIGNTVSVPEPGSTLVASLIGLLGLYGLRRRVS